MKRALLAAGLAILVATSASGQGADGVFETRRSSHFVLHQDVAIDRASGWQGSVRFEREVLEVLEAGYDQLDGRLGLRPPRELTVVLYDPAVFDAGFAGLFRFPAAGFYAGVIRIRGDVAVTLPLQRTLLHELVHAAFDAEAPSLVLPAWFNEGLAEWFEARVTGAGRLTPGQWATLASGAATGRLPAFSALAAPSYVRLSPRDAAIAYLYSRGLVDHIVRRRSEADLRRACRELLRTRNLVRAFEKTTRASPAEHDRAFRRELLGGR